MLELRKKIKILGMDVDAVDVPITRANETTSEYELEDGSILRVKNVANSFLRLEGQFNPDGTPIYLVQGGPVVTVVGSAKEVKPQ